MRGTASRDRQRGGAILEGALTLLVFMTLLFGIIDFGRMLWVYTQLAHGTREATRFASVSGTSSGRTASRAQIGGMVATRSPGLGAGSLTTVVTFIPDQNPGGKVRVQATYNFYPFGLLMPVGPINLRSTSEMVIYQ